jgi:hypothetical protein
MEPRWITVFVDQPADRFEAGTDFWATVTGSSVSARRGEQHEFATLLPADGDACCRVQKTVDGSAGIHIDFHVESVPAAMIEAEERGATLLHDRGHVVMSSPEGLTFCLVAHRGERDIPSPVGDPSSALDQICIDIPAARFDDEVRFWRELFGWADQPVGRAEFHRLVEPAGLPYRFLFQRLEPDAPARSVAAHLDVAAGEERLAVAARHEALGATRLAVFDRWIVMRDPVGLEYCVTGRTPGVTRT